MIPIQPLQRNRPARLQHLQRLAAWGLLALLTKVLLAILVEYRHYFPPDFDVAFLTGRRTMFVGWYPAAFYTHILSGPIVLVLGALLMFSGSRPHLRSVHRRVARVQMLLLFVALVPSGLLLASQAQAGPLAGWGFAGLSLTTAATAAAAVYFATTGDLQAHRRWATRCLLLLVSPLLLRLTAGLAIMTHLDSDGFYQANAWLSWLIPLAGFELWRRFGRLHSLVPPIQEPSHA